MITYKRVFTIRILTLVWLVLFPLFVNSQVLPDLGENGIEQLTDEEIKAYWSQVSSQGYTVEQLKSVALLRGYSQADILALEQRIQGLGLNNDTTLNDEQESTFGLTDQETFGMDGSESKDVLEDNPLFGYDFFNNDNITFTPNLNLATPESYQLGPGDELIINLWGAAEQLYQKQIDREGAIRINGVGPVYLGGLDIAEAKGVLKQKLLTIYQGLSAPAGSLYKINLDISLANVRSVQVDIIGEVKVPGSYTLNSLSNVLNALYASGGPTMFGTFRNVKLVRNGTTVGVFDIYDYIINGSQQGNLSLKDRDVIIVSPYLSRVSITGNVKRPGLYELMPDETILDLLEFTSGFTSNAYRDLIVLERIEADRKVIKEIAFGTASLVPLKDGDAVIVRETINKFTNKVSIEGAVYRDGQYELTPGLTLSGLIEKAAGVKADVFLERGIVIRTKNGVSRSIESFSVKEVLDGTYDLALQPDDVVRIYDNFSLTEEYTLTIDGAVNNPSEFTYMDNMTVEDLIIMAGGFTDTANPNIIDIFRRISDDKFETLSESFQITADGSLRTQNNEPFYLLPDDKVSVRFLKGAKENIRAAIIGEANYPGTYSIETKGERISDLLERAGGLSPYAYPAGASLIRLNPYFKGAGQDLSIDELANNILDSDSTDLNNRRAFRVGIDLGAILRDKEKNAKFDLIIQNGDRLVIPSFKQTVKVEGEILLPSLVRYDENYSLKDYIDRSGGFSQKAKKGKTYVIYSNGDIASTKRFLFFKSYPELRPGAIILVPEKENARNRLSAQELVSMTTAVVALSLLVERLIN